MDFRGKYTAAQITADDSVIEANEGSKRKGSWKSQEGLGYTSLDDRMTVVVVVTLVFDQAAVSNDFMLTFGIASTLD